MSKYPRVVSPAELEQRLRPQTRPLPAWRVIRQALLDAGLVEQTIEERWTREARDLRVWEG